MDRFDGLEEVRTKMPGSGKLPALSIAVELDQDLSRGLKRLTYSFRLAQKKRLAVDEEELSATIYKRARGKPNPPAKANFSSEDVITVGFRVYNMDSLIAKSSPAVSDVEVALKIHRNSIFRILLDGDVFFSPYENLGAEIRGMRDRAARISAELNVTIITCWAIRCLESWIIGGIARRDSSCGLVIGTKRVIPADITSAPENQTMDY